MSGPATPKWNVQAPDGKVIQFPDTFQQSDVEREMNKMYPAQSNQATSIFTKPQTSSTLSTAAQNAKDLGIGVSQGAANTVGSSISGIGRLIRNLGGAMQSFPSPAVATIGRGLQAMEPEEGLNALDARTKERSTPQNMMQTVGKVGEQGGEFMLPGVGEEDVLAHLPLLSKLGRMGRPLGRIAYQAGTTGLMNAAQGGSPVTGAALGAGGGVIGEGLRAAAPAMAESALGITKRMRGYGKTPGLAALQETKGILPSTVEQSAQGVTKGLTSDIGTMASSYPGTVSTQPGIDVIDREIAKATAENNAQAVEQLGRVRDALATNITTGQPLPTNQPATGALNLKRGLRSQFVKNWNPELMEGTRAVAARASGAIDNSLDTALGPEFQSANQRISSLIPVAERSESLGRDPGILQNIGGRFGAHTGALIGSAIGGSEGYRRAGLPGAIGGALSGLVLPEILASPEAQMFAARRMFNPTQLLNLTRGLGLQFDRSNQQPEQQYGQ